MTMVLLLLTVIAGALIHIGSTIYDKGYRQLGTVFILVGLFQIIAELIAHL